MMEVVFWLIGILLGWFLSTMFSYVKYYIGNIRVILINDKVEKIQLALDNYNSIDILKKGKYAIVKIDRYYNQDPDPLDIQPL